MGPTETQELLAAVAAADGITSSRWAVQGVGAEKLGDAHPHAGASVLSYDGPSGQGASILIEGPTWLDLWRAADAAIGESGDTHHVFIEGFTSQPGGVLELVTGS